MRDIISLACTHCQRRNYTTTKNKRTHPDRVEIKKFASGAGSTRRTRKRE